MCSNKSTTGTEAAQTSDLNSVQSGNPITEETEEWYSYLVTVIVLSLFIFLLQIVIIVIMCHLMSVSRQGQHSGSPNGPPGSQSPNMQPQPQSPPPPSQPPQSPPPPQILPQQQQQQQQQPNPLYNMSPQQQEAYIDMWRNYYQAILLQQQSQQHRR